MERWNCPLCRCFSNSTRRAKHRKRENTRLKSQLSRCRTLICSGKVLVRIRELAARGMTMSETPERDGDVESGAWNSSVTCRLLPKTRQQTMVAERHVTPWYRPPHTLSPAAPASVYVCVCGRVSASTCYPTNLCWRTYCYMDARSAAFTLFFFSLFHRLTHFAIIFLSFVFRFRFGPPHRVLYRVSI